jgi:hypothetical protein
MSEETPADGNGDYILLGNKGAMYYANRYHDVGLFHVPNNRDNMKSDNEVKAWAEIPPLEAHMTCRNVSDVDGTFICSECKCQIEGMVVLNGANRWAEPPYCPNCGREVES